MAGKELIYKTQGGAGYFRERARGAVALLSPAKQLRIHAPVNSSAAQQGSGLCCATRHRLRRTRTTSHRSVSVRGRTRTLHHEIVTPRRTGLILVSEDGGIRRLICSRMSRTARRGLTEGPLWNSDCDQEKRLLLEILEERHRNLIHEIPPTDHRDFKHELQGRCSVIEGILRKMQAQKNVQLSSTTQLAAFAMCSGFWRRAPGTHPTLPSPKNTSIRPSPKI